MSTVSESCPDRAKTALSHEWLVARIVLIGGGVIAVAAIVWFGWVQPDMARRELIAKIVSAENTFATEATDLCKTGLKSAKDFGLVPSYGTLVSKKFFYRTTVAGRYACIAATHATNYVVAVDAVCRNFNDARCVKLYSVIDQNNKLILYQRQS